MLHRVVGVARVVGEEEEARGDLVGRADDGQHEVAAHAADRHLTGQHAGLELQHVELARRRVGLGADGVLSVALAEQVGVVACPAAQGVVAGPAVQGVGSVVTVQVVVPVPTPERVITVLPVQRVVACTSVDQVVASAAAEGIGSGVAEVDVTGARAAGD